MSDLVRRLSTASADFEVLFQRLQHDGADGDPAIDARVASIIADVRARGDAAVLELTARFDGVQAADMAALEIGHPELKAAFDAITPAQRSALQAAASTSAFFSPFGVGTTMMISPTPATWAGMAFISTLEGYAALPPGT